MKARPLPTATYIIILQLGNASLATVLPFSGFIWINMGFIQYKVQAACLIRPMHAMYYKVYI